MFKILDPFFINLFKFNIKNFIRLFINLFIYLDVLEMLDERKFDKLSSLLTQQPNIINSLRDEHELTLMMNAAHNQRNDFVNFLLKKPHDVSVVDVDGFNVCLLYTSPSPRDRG